MSKHVTTQSFVLFPADVDEILNKYEDFLESYEETNCFGSFKRTKTTLDVLFPLKKHPVYGPTAIHAIEQYDSRGYVVAYKYEWRQIPSEQHICAWEHDAKHISTANKSSSQEKLHLHYHIPGDRTQSKQSLEVQSLLQVFEFVVPFIENGEAYKP